MYIVYQRLSVDWEFLKITIKQKVAVLFSILYFFVELNILNINVYKAVHASFDGFYI